MLLTTENGTYFTFRFSHNQIPTDDIFQGWPDIDNPDQRISLEIGSFAQTNVNFGLTVFNQIIDLIAFSGILWSISKTLVGVLILYAVMGNLITAFFSQRLIQLNGNQFRYEANFRYGLVHVRNNAESIAFYGGEEQESSRVR